MRFLISDRNKSACLEVPSQVMRALALVGHRFGQDHLDLGDRLASLASRGEQAAQITEKSQRLRLDYPVNQKPTFRAIDQTKRAYQGALQLAKARYGTLVS